MSRVAVSTLVVALALAGCSGAGSSGSASRADAATEAACRQRADQIYEQRNRAEIYSPQPSINTPSSGSYAPGATDRGLSDIFARDSMIRDCVRNTGTGADRSEPLSSAPVVVPARR